MMKHTPPDTLYLCRICRRPLNEYVEYDDDDNPIRTELQHGVMTGVPPHDPDPIRADSVGNEQVIICDFCSAPHPTWSYPARSFEAPEAAYGSVDDWAACEACHSLIESDGWDALAERSIRALPKQVPSVFRPEVKRRMLGLHATFREARCGEAVRA